jgi:nicotinamide mononucleotide (NMN) deamidase PncC
VIDEDGLLGSVQVFLPSDKYTLVSVKAVQPLLQKLLAHAATTAGIKVVALVGPKDTYITELLQVLH